MTDLLQDSNRVNEPDVIRSPRVGARVMLKPVTSADYDFLFALATDPEVGLTWRWRGGTPSPEEFVGGLWRDVVMQYIIVHRPTSQSIGLVSCFNPDHRNGVADIGIAVGPQIVGDRLAMEGLILFLDHLFSVRRVRKLYAETSDRSFMKMASGIGDFCRVEGQFREHEAFGDEFWDVYLLGLHRDRWQETAQRYLPYVLGTKQPQPLESRPAQILGFDAFVAQIGQEVNREDLAPTDRTTPLRDLLDSLELVETAEAVEDMIGKSLPDELIGPMTLDSLYAMYLDRALG